MATVINNPGDGGGGGNDSSSGVFIGIILAVVVAGALFFIYGLPAMRNTDTGPTINVPDKVQIDVNAPKSN